VIELLGREVASVLDRDTKFPLLAFGDAGSVDHPSGCVLVGEAAGIDGVQGLYRSFASDPRVVKSGPTSFAGVVGFAIDRVISTKGRFHTLVIITDGQINDEREEPGAEGKWVTKYPTIEKLVEASMYPLEVVIVGVGDGPWGMMESLDDKIVEFARGKYRVDCVQFVPFTRFMPNMHDVRATQDFTVSCLQEIPQLKLWLDAHGKFGSAAKTEPYHSSPVRWEPMAAGPSTVASSSVVSAAATPTAPPVIFSS
jgi:E3 ubiquitin-protein ligase RGLG